jgi:broad specificity phosphatase PhoE
VSLNLYFLRHGQTEFSRNNSFCGSTDAELTADGLEMAQAVADYYSSTPWKAIFSSPMRRTLATVKPLCDAIGVEPELRVVYHRRYRLKEIDYGLWEGKTPEVISKEFHDEYIRWLADPGWNAPNQGEMAVAIASRAMQVVEEIKERYTDGNVLIVSHKATIRITLCSLLGIDVGRFRFRLGCPVGSVSIVEFGSHGPLLKVLSDRTHQSERLRHLPGT